MRLEFDKNPQLKANGNAVIKKIKCHKSCCIRFSA